MLPLVLLAVLSGAPAATKKPAGPHPTETAKLFFLAGDIAKAQEFARACVRREPKKCGPINGWIAEYAFLIRDADTLTVEQARQLLELDKKIAPNKRGKLTETVVERYVTRPLERARSLSTQDRLAALHVVEQVLTIEPANAAALELQKSLRNGVDGGP